MKKLFVDTSGFVALQDKNDRNHQKAIKFWHDAALEPTSIYTTNYIFDETYTLLLCRIGRDAAIDFGSALTESKVIQIVFIDENLHQKAWDIAIKFKDKSFSFTDCTSFAAMNDIGIVEAFSFGNHFKQFGSINCLPK